MKQKLRALVVDDSAYNRRTLTRMLESGEVEVVGTAADGEEALREALRLSPDLITLDLEMPRMDGFTFLRILMARQPTPVIVISSYARKANVFRALELGAVDFIPKPSRFITEEIEVIREELLTRLATVRGLSPGKLGPRRALEPSEGPVQKPASSGPMRVVAIGSSTGGPPALHQIMDALPDTLGAAVVVCQHMPPRFTKAFADRMNRSSPLEVREAAEGDLLEPGLVLVAPGGHRTEVVRKGRDLRIRITEESDPGRPVPNIDALFLSLAESAADRTLGAVLTGMGRDGRDGAGRLKAAGGQILAEAEETAVVYGMPREVVAAGHVDRVLPLGAIPDAIVTFAGAGKLPQYPER